MGIKTLITFSLLSSQTVFADSSTLPSVANKYPSLNVKDEIVRYTRCYAHLARTFVPKNDYRLERIKTKAVTGTEACMDLLESGEVNANGTVEKNGVISSESKAVLKTLYDFHRSWFPSYNFRTAIPLQECYQSTFYLYNYGEMALHLTNALFTKNVQFSSVVTNPTSFEPIRQDMSGGTTTVLDKVITPIKYQATSTAALVDFTPKFMTTGELIGFKKMETDTLPDGVTDYRASNGGGILGTVPYLMLNSGRGANETMDGGLKQYRRWSRAVLNDLLCRDVPAIRPIDALPYVNGSSTLTFRKGASCMQCHATMDPMAQVQRNRIFTGISKKCDATTAAYIQNVPVTLAQEAGPVDVDANFQKRPPKGTFFFRGYDGTLHSPDVSDVSGLGEYLATTDDLYICAAKRYYQFLTGIDVPMFDPGDPNAPVLSAKEKTYHNIVINLGKDLKKTQNLEAMIKKIIGSGAYLRPGVGEE